MPQFCFTASARLLVWATHGGETAHLLQVERPGLSRKEVKELDDEKNVVGIVASSGVELSLEDDPSLLHKRGETQPPKVDQMGSKRKDAVFEDIGWQKEEKNRNAQ